MPVAAPALRRLAAAAAVLLATVPALAVASEAPPGRSLSAEAVRVLVSALALLAAAAAGALGWRQRALGLFDRAPTPAEVGPAWLGADPPPAEVAGLAWHGRVGPPEVAALLARLAREGTLRVGAGAGPGPGAGGGTGELELTLLAPLASLRGHEQVLAHALFFDGPTTSAGRLRAHYRLRGLDPAGLVADGLEAALQAAAPQGAQRTPRAWPAAGALLLLAALALVLADEAGGARPQVMALGGLAAGLLAAAAVGLLARRGRHRPAAQVWTASLAVAALAGAGAGVVELLRATGPSRAGALTALGAATGWLGLALLLLAIAWPRGSPARVALQRRVAALRIWLRVRLLDPVPDLEAAWGPYLVALGLGDEAARRGLDAGAPGAWAALASLSSPIAAPADGPAARPR